MLEEMGESGTEIFIGDLKQPQVLRSKKEDGDIVLHENICDDYGLDQHSQVIETSLRTYLKYLYLTYPCNTKIFVNEKEIETENPYFKQHAMSPQFFTEMPSSQKRLQTYLLNPQNFFKKRQKTDKDTVSFLATI